MTTHRQISIGVGSRFANHELLDELGYGGAGKIFLARHVESGERVAMKVLRPDAEADQDIHSRFIREISVAQKLNDPHIIAYQDCGVEDGILYFTMEYVPWGTLSDVLRKRSILQWKEACECGEQICQGLHHLHQSNIVHRDLKPANIFLSETGRLKLGDFGLARDFESHRLTTDGITVGTGRYMAPEQARGESDIDLRTDLYALGCNLFELLVGHTPFDEHDVHDPVPLGELMRRHVEQPAPKVIDLIRTCPQSLSDLVGRLLSKDRDDRPGSAAEVAIILRRILQDPSAPLNLDPLEPEAEPEPEVHRDHPATAKSPGEEAHLTARLRTTGARGSTEITTGRLAISIVVVAVIIAVAAWFGSSRP